MSIEEATMPFCFEKELPPGIQTDGNTVIMNSDQE